MAKELNQLHLLVTTLTQNQILLCDKINEMDKKIDDNYAKLDKKIDENYAKLDKKINDNTATLTEMIHEITSKIASLQKEVRFLRDDIDTVYALETESRTKLKKLF